MFEAFMGHVIRAAPSPLAGALTRELSAFVPRTRTSEAQRAAMTQATQSRYGSGGNVAWSWGDGPTVVLVHGWGGAATQMAPLAAYIASLGYRALAPDVTGHGASPGWRTSWSHFIDDVAAVTAGVREVHAIVGHSAGALATMAARRIAGVRARIFVGICAPAYPYPPIDMVRARLNPGPAVLADYQRHIAAQFCLPWEQLLSAPDYAGIDALHLAYDVSDRLVHAADADRIAIQSPNARTLSTKGHGHVRILGAPELWAWVAVALRGSVDARS